MSTISMFFFKEYAATESEPYVHTFSLHDALPISNPPLLDQSRERRGGEGLGARADVEERGGVDRHARTGLSDDRGPDVLAAHHDSDAGPGAGVDQALVRQRLGQVAGCGWRHRRPALRTRGTASPPGAWLTNSHSPPATSAGAPPPTH